MGTMIFYGKLPTTDRWIALHIEKGRIAGVEPSRKKQKSGRSSSDLYISPGFFDPQVNGFAGIDFNRKDLTVRDIHQAILTLSSTGVTTFFPTLITASFERLFHQIKILSKAIEGDSLISKMCPGIHLEGPYLSPEKGPRGLHEPQFIRPPKWDEFERLQGACNGRIKMITLAPETEGGLDFIKRAVSRGVVVAIGHTAASDEVLEAAMEAGATLSTHLGNGIGERFPLRRNPFQKQLAMDGLMASIIVDGIHLPDYMVKNITRAKGVDRILLTTDAVSAAGQPPGKFELGDLEIEVNNEGRSCLVGTDSLAGSTLSMPKSITNIIRFAGIDLGTAIKMGSENGKKLFPEWIATIAPNQPANLVLFRYEGEVIIEKTILMGEEVWPNLNPKFQIPNPKTF
jgi:N-acetylglucosamine-6-phosphate deacetylase